MKFVFGFSFEKHFYLLHQKKNKTKKKKNGAARFF